VPGGTKIGLGSPLAQPPSTTSSVPVT
jgi:hypothetical protein